MQLQDLSAEEQQKLAACVNPDTTSAFEAKFDYGPAIQDQILNIVWKDREIMDRVVNVMKPTYFGSINRERLCSILMDYYKAYDGLPSLEYITEEYKRRFNPDDSKCIPWMAFLKSVNACNEPELHEKKALLDLIQDYCRVQATRLVMDKIVNEATKDTSPDRFNKVESLLREFKLPNLSASNKAVSSWGEVCATAEGQAEDWLIPNWSEYGCLTLFSSLPKLGKSTIIAELVACLMLGRDFYGQDVNPAPVLLVDPENREKTLVRRINHACGDDGHGRLGEWFFRLNAFPKPLDNSYLKRAIQDVKKATGEDRVVVVLDTLRSCYAGEIENENDNSEMAKVLSPLKDMAAELNVALFLVHHNNKGADSYAGGTAILGTVDYYWNWKNDRAKRHGCLTCWGRGDFTEPIELMFDLETQRNVVHVPGPDVKIDKNLLAIPVEGLGVTIDHLMQVWEAPQSTAYRRVKAYIDKGTVEAVVPEDAAGKTHYRQIAA